MNMRNIARKAGIGALCVTGLAAYVVVPALSHGDPYASASPKPAEPHRITLVRGMTGLALDRIAWRSERRASGELELTGEGAGDLGKVAVTVRRARGAIVALKLAGKVTVSKTWTFSRGHWSAS